jgi:hypothetical protein
MHVKIRNPPPPTCNMQFLAENGKINSALPVSDESLAGRPPVGKLGDLPAMFSSKSGRGESICFLFVFLV